MLHASAEQESSGLASFALPERRQAPLPMNGGTAGVSKWEEKDSMGDPSGYGMGRFAEGGVLGVLGHTGRAAVRKFSLSVAALALAVMMPMVDASAQQA